MANPSIVSPSIVLASASKIRAQILENAGIDFTVRPSFIDEDRIKQNHLAQGRDITELVENLARAKAAAVAMASHEIIIGADQILEFEGKIFDKPKTLDEAKARLKHMRAKQHRLIGAVCLVQKNHKPWCHISTTKLNMRDFSDKFLKTYLQEEQETLLATVGGYKFEGRGAMLFEKVEGDFFSILGLSLLPLLAELRHRAILEA